MTYDVRICQVSAQMLAVARGRATAGTLIDRLFELLDEVHRLLAQGTVAGTMGDGRLGRNVFLYRGAPDRDLLASPEGLPIEAGIEVPAPFAGAGAILCSETPAGTAAMAAHVGPYEQVGNASAAVRQWCSDNGYAVTGTNWEVYGHWADDPDQRRTDIYYLLA